MTALTWFLRFIIFAFLVIFALQNTAPVTLSLALDYQWQAPLVIVLLAFFGAGALLGVLSLVGTIFRQRREIARLKRALLKVEQAPLPDLPPQQ
ncbi:lipopolysaccharide assembly LapA domain-containing protein [Azonexus sp.]|uniref:LapA family protein n=1 Tax=Azonexus sp. TaxID=1872668 RepID=UPI0035AFB027